MSPVERGDGTCVAVSFFFFTFFTLPLEAGVYNNNNNNSNSSNENNSNTQVAPYRCMRRCMRLGKEKRGEKKKDQASECCYCERPSFYSTDTCVLCLVCVCVCVSGRVSSNSKMSEWREGEDLALFLRQGWYIRVDAGYILYFVIRPFSAEPRHHKAVVEKLVHHTSYEL